MLSSGGDITVQLKQIHRFIPILPVTLKTVIFPEFLLRTTSCRYTGSKLWNYFSHVIKQCSTTKGFKRCLKNPILRTP